MKAFEKEFAKGATASGLYHVAKYWYKRGMLHAAEIADNEKYKYFSPSHEEDVCLDIYAAIRKEAGE